MAVVGSAIGLVLIVVIAGMLLSGGAAVEESADQAGLSAKGKSVNRPEDDDSAKRIVRIPPEEQFDEGRKWALVIGNDAYEDAPLSGPVNDAKDMASTLEELGFLVTTLTDGTQRQMEDALRAFGRSVGEGDTALFYFSGHGAQTKGVNYLIPIQADIHSGVDLRYKAIPAEMVLAQLEQAGSAMNIIILDACRAEPFKRFKSLQSGLAQMDSPAGTIIAYATAPGTVALAAGADERNSVYTKHLLRAIKTPGLKVEEVFKQVRVDVVKETAEGQVPWESSSLIGEFCFAAGRERGASMVADGAGAPRAGNEQSPSPGPSTGVDVPSAPGTNSPPNTLTQEAAEGFTSLFDGKSLGGWQGATEHYLVEDGKLVSNFGDRAFRGPGDGHLFTTREYDDFLLRFDFKIAPDANSGVLIRSPCEGWMPADGMEVQVCDHYSPIWRAITNSRPDFFTGAIAGVAAPSLGYEKAPGQWNRMEIMCRGRRAKVTLNEAVVLDVDLDEAAKSTPDGKSYPGLKRAKGYIGLIGTLSQGRVEYRNIRIKELAAR